MMQSVNLSLFELETSQTTVQHEKISEEKIVAPVIQVLERVTPEHPFTSENNITSSQSLKKSLDDFFPEQQYEEKIIQEAKKILGPIVNEFTSEQLKDSVTEIMFLVETWLDDFERESFDGLTLKELLHEKGAK